MNVQTLTDTYTQRNTKHNRNNYRQRQIFWDDVNPKRLKPDMSFILRIWEIGTRIVPPKNISRCYCKNFEIIIWVMYDYQSL